MGVEPHEGLQAYPHARWVLRPLLIQVQGPKYLRPMLRGENHLEAFHSKVDVLHMEHGPVALVQFGHIDGARAKDVAQCAQALAVVCPLPHVVW